jgi:signal transduction histidine kinase/DNA-binding response OmpR family regulator
MERSSISGRGVGTAIVAGALALIALVWLGTFAVLHETRREVEAQEAAELANEALIFADRMSDHLNAIEQTLRILEHDWETNPEGFDLSAWRQRALVLSDPALQICVTDANGIIRVSTVPELVGRDVSKQAFFSNRAALPSDDGKMFLGPAARSPIGDGWALNVSRRLDFPDGSFAGVIGVAYDMGELIRFYGQIELGPHGLVELVGDKDGQLRAAVGGGATPGQSIDGAEMLQQMRRYPNGRWIGPSAPDGVERIHAFRRLGNRDLDVVVAETMEQAQRTSLVWQREALAFACLTTLLVAVLAGGLLVNVRTARLRVQALAEDRTKLAAAKADVDAKSARLEVTLAGMSDGVAMMDSELRLVEWNARFAEMSGIPVRLLIRGVPLERLLRIQVHAEERGNADVEAEIAERLKPIRAGVDAAGSEWMRADGRTIAIRSRRLQDGSFVAIYTDITERKRNEESLRRARVAAEATSEAKSRFVAMVSHEIRQPLNALLGSLALLAAEDMPSQARHLVGTAKHAGDALLGLLNDVLELSKMEAGQLVLRPVTFALRPLLRGVLDMFADQAATRGITLSLNVTNTCPDRLQSDPARIRQILMNLVSNAVKFARAGRVELRAEADSGPDGEVRMLRLMVRDPGPAIDPGRRDRLFQPFAQLGGAARSHAGTGLGLAVCQTLAGLLGGTIGYEPTAEGGNAFWVRLAYSPPAEVPVPLLAARPIYPRTRILVVEDIPANQLMIATLLRREGHMVDVAASGPDAVRAIASRPYDLVLMDILMPGMTGTETARHIRALSGSAGSVRICALTGNFAPQDLAACAEAGIDEVLGKPVDLDALLAVLGRLVWRGHPGRAGQRPRGLPAAEPGLPPLMPARLADLRANLTPESLADLAEQSIDELEARLPLLQAALASGDPAGIELQSHAMGGLAGNYAMAALGFRMDAILEAVRSAGPARAAEVAGDLEAELARAAAALRKAVAMKTAAE